MSVPVADMHTATSGRTWPLLGVTRPLHLGNRGFEAGWNRESCRIGAIVCGSAISDSITIAKMVIEASKAK
jgi:hypothetical protein